MDVDSACWASFPSKNWKNSVWLSKLLLMGEMFLYVWLPVLTNRVMQVYLRKLPVVFDILNGQHGT